MNNTRCKQCKEYTVESRLALRDDDGYCVSCLIEEFNNRGGTADDVEDDPEGLFRVLKTDRA